MIFFDALMRHTFYQIMGPRNLESIDRIPHTTNLESSNQSADTINQASTNQSVYMADQAVIDQFADKTKQASTDQGQVSLPPLKTPPKSPPWLDMSPVYALLRQKDPIQVCYPHPINENCNSQLAQQLSIRYDLLNTDRQILSSIAKRARKDTSRMNKLTSFLHHRRRKLTILWVPEHHKVFKKMYSEDLGGLQFKMDTHREDLLDITNELLERVRELS